ncbi:M48 family metallopeptidase [Fibrella aquatica]|jgi:metalloprotease|uniref:M48 family metallopeptidase n=1 Tax=Fibrella aquatica TaxID=3242487 RepID=UPI003522BA87
MNRFSLLLVGSLLTSSTLTLAQNGGLTQAALEAASSFVITNAQVADASRQAVQQMDAKNPIAGPNDPYTVRLNKIVSRHRSMNGVPINYKVYMVKDVNAFATADGSVRVMKGLMDLMTDQELLAVMGHEIGHVINQDSRDGMKAAIRRSAAINALGSTSGTLGKLSRSQLAGAFDYVANAKFSRQQETEADDYSYQFLKKNGYSVMALASSFEKLAKLSGGGGGKLTEFMSSHPDSAKRAQRIRDRAKRDGLTR